jgi:hypothetical protein
MNYKRLNTELELYWTSQLKKVPDPNGDGYYFTYNNSKFNAPTSGILNEIMVNDMNDVQRLLFLMIISSISRGNNMIQNGGLFLEYKNYKGVIGKNSFYKAKKKFIELELLLPVNSNKKYFILNNRYIVKMYNPKNE